MHQKNLHSQSSSKATKIDRVNELSNFIKKDGHNDMNLKIRLFSAAGIIENVNDNSFIVVPKKELYSFLDTFSTLFSNVNLLLEYYA